MKDEQKISKNRERKQAIVAEIAEKVGKAKAMVFTNYQGLTHVQLEKLKKALKRLGAELVVTKNTLLKRALSDGRCPPRFPPLAGGRGKIEDGKSFDKPTATLFIYEDVILPLKELAKTMKNLKLPTVKFGLFEGKILEEADVVRLSTLPSREVLLAQVIGGLKSPIFSLHRALNWNLQRLAITLQQIKNQKENIKNTN